MPFFKIVFIYTQGDKGWNQVYYREEATLAAAASLDVNLQSKLVDWRANGTVLRKARVSDTLNNRNSLVVNINRPSQQVLSSPDITGAAAVVAHNSSAIGGRRFVWLRGIADIDINRDLNTGLDLPGPRLLAAIPQMGAYFIANNFRIRVLTKLGIPPNIYQPINSITGVVGSGQATLTFIGTSIPLVGSRVIISRASQKDFPALNGHYTVLAVGANTITIPYNLHFAGPFGLPNARFRPESYVYGAFDSFGGGFVKFGTRDTGKNPLGGRGRRTGQRLRSA